MFRKLLRYFRRLVRIFGMAPEPPKIRSLFTELERSSFAFSPIEDWYLGILECEATLDCSVTEVGWYKNLSGKEEHEFLQFNVLSPDRKHVAIVIVERGRGEQNSTKAAAQPTEGVAPLDTSAGPVTPPAAPPETAVVVGTPPDVSGDSTASSADESSPPLREVNKANGKGKQKDRDSSGLTTSFASISSWRYANDLASWATRDSQAGEQLQRRCEKATSISALEFRENHQPSVHELATLVHLTSKHEPNYNIRKTQCYWFAETVFKAVDAIFEGAERAPKNNRAGTWARVPVSRKESVDAVCAQYYTTRVALLEELVQQKRLKREQEEQRQREREQRQAAEEAAKRAEEERRAAEERAQAAEEERRAAEERARAAEEKERLAAEEAAQKERAAEERARAAEEASAKLLQELEALKRAVASTQQA
ncbi:hypothetical protein BKA82DRAFT_4048573 [Pisolithus tinctorius]|nr:hypothetical protein BKA82DRAFT_4048573 [Pisolithus tinctorius]